MNKELRDFGIQSLREGLSQLSEGPHIMFKRMYGRNGGKRSHDDALAMSIDEVLVELPDEKIDWAMQQVQRSIEKQQPRKLEGET